MGFPDAAWMARYRATVNGDPELAAVGRHFTADFLLDFERARYLVRVAAGAVAEVVDVAADPPGGRPAAFAFRAPEAVWRRFLEAVPPPLHNHLFALLMRVPAFRLEGDPLAVMRDVRALARMLDLMRTVPEAG